MKTKILSKLSIATLAVALFASCQNDDPHADLGYNDGVARPYVIASQGTFSNTTTNALLSAESLEGGSV